MEVDHIHCSKHAKERAMERFGIESEERAEMLLKLWLANGELVYRGRMEEWHYQDVCLITTPRVSGRAVKILTVYSLQPAKKRKRKGRRGPCHRHWVPGSKVLCLKNPTRRRVERIRRQLLREESIDECV